MAKTITFNRAVEGKDGKPTTKEDQGKIALIPLVAGDKPHKFVICKEGLLDYRSGYRFGQLEAIKIERMARISTYTRTTDRQAARILVDRVVAHYGIDVVRERLAQHPTINS
jgi:HJR/Mrr/RecB family endonuclease